MKSQFLAGVVAGAAALAAATTASAAPVTVDLRVEGPTSTLVEQKVTVDVRTLKFTDSPTTYQCDSTSPSGTGTVPAPTRGGALSQAAELGGFELTGVYNQQYGSPTYDRINGTQIPPYAQDNKYLVEFKNGVQSGFGACGDPIANGDDVLFAYGDGSEQELHLAGPATVKPGDTATFAVTDEADGSPVAGAATAGGATSGSDGKVTTPALLQRGPQTFKATKTGAIRSNAVTVCVTDGADGFCGTTVPGSPGTTTAAPAATPSAVVVPDKVAAFGKLGSVVEGKTYALGAGPRVLAGTVDANSSGLKDVRLRLSRTNGKACTYYDGVKERFVKTSKCGVKNAKSFSVGSTSPFSYLLPSALPKGRYVLDVIVQDRSKNQTLTYQRGRNRVVFVVG